MAKKQIPINKDKKEEYLKEAIKIASEQELYFIEDISALMPVSLSTMYYYKLQESEELKAIIKANKQKKKLKLRKNWEDSTNATLQIALYKLLATNEERKILSDSEITVTFGDLPTNIDELSDEEVEKLYKEYTNGSKAKDS